MLYNTELKNIYISTINDRVTKQNLLNWFSKAAPYEQKDKTDVSGFTVAELMSFYKDGIHTASDTYLIWIHTSLAQYAKQVNPDGQHFDEVSTEMLQMCVDRDALRSKIIMREDLLRELESTFTNAMEKAILLGLFEGLLLTDFDSLSADDLKGNIVTTSGGRNLSISDELQKYIIQAANTYELIPYTDNPKYTISKYCDLDPNDNRVIKMMKAYPDSDRMFRYRNIIKRCKTISGAAWVNAAELPQSGAASMIRDWLTPSCSVEDVVSKHITELKERYGKSWEYDRIFQEKYGYLYK